MLKDCARDFWDDQESSEDSESDSESESQSTSLIKFDETDDFINLRNPKTKFQHHSGLIDSSL
jgi:hypothetical protein